ncbi:GntR family transcriptional regulator [Catenuloplanes sp. NPDC051500]|uniref:GntR family transcriptional regulator n=1 Tax=Catenuloplanes sp. NPDC051500 TaxID=3363959 RepID=UPI00378BF5E2
MIERGSEVPLHRQLAALLAAQIEGGLPPPGYALPSESELCRLHGLGRTTVRAALRLLRERRLVVTRDGYGTLVRVPPDRELVEIGPGDEVISRAPTLIEEGELGLDELEQVVEITTADGATRRYGADRVRVCVRR